MYMRIAPELYLKQLLVGGYDKVFELGKNYRNEGLDRSHNPEFTTLEIYEAYGDVRTMMKLVEELVSGAAQEVCGTMTVGKEGQEPIDLTPAVARGGLPRPGARKGGRGLVRPLRGIRLRLGAGPGSRHPERR